MTRQGTIRNTAARLIDWEQARTRLQASEQALQAALSENPARIEAAYRQRAAQIARGRSRQRFVLEGSPALVFSLGQERYAIELTWLAEVLPYANCAAVPGSTPAFCGVMNVRGDLRAVVDLGRLLLATEGSGDSGFVLMLRQPGREIGLRVDRIEGLREIAADHLSPVGHSRYGNALRGEALMLLDLDQLLAEVFTGGKTT